MSAFVVDASVAAKWFVEEVGTPAAREVLGRPEDRVAPDLVWIEVAATAAKKAGRGEITPAQAHGIVDAVPRFFHRLVAFDRLLRRAAHISLAADCTLQDGVYLALAEAEDTVVLTADAKLARTVAGTLWAVRVEVVG